MMGARARRQVEDRFGFEPYTERHLAWYFAAGAALG
jgi:hypothetical protein